MLLPLQATPAYLKSNTETQKFIQAWRNGENDQSDIQIKPFQRRHDDFDLQSWWFDIKCKHCWPWANNRKLTLLGGLCSSWSSCRGNTGSLEDRWFWQQLLHSALSYQIFQTRCLPLCHGFFQLDHAWRWGSLLELFFYG